jgi:hypothetical protein
LIVHGQAETGSVELVSGNYFRGLGIFPTVGGLIADNDDRAGAPQVAVLSYNYWRNRFSGEPAVVAKQYKSI